MKSTESTTYTASAPHADSPSTNFSCACEPSQQSIHRDISYLKYVSTCNLQPQKLHGPISFHHETIITNVSCYYHGATPMRNEFHLRYILLRVTIFGWIFGLFSIIRFHIRCSCLRAMSIATLRKEPFHFSIHSSQNLILLSWCFHRK